MSGELNVSLRPFVETDRVQLDAWAARIGSAQYMSRYSPEPEAVAAWYIVVVGSRDVGTVWLERTPAQDTATLGVLLGEPELFGQGVGRTSINLALEQARFLPGLRVVQLHVRSDNLRAIRCYESCGFKVVSSGTRSRGGARYEFFRMEKHLVPYDQGPDASWRA